MKGTRGQTRAPLVTMTTQLGGSRKGDLLSPITGKPVIAALDTAGSGGSK